MPVGKGVSKPVPVINLYKDGVKRTVNISDAKAWNAKGWFKKGDEPVEPAVVVKTDIDNQTTEETVDISELDVAGLQKVVDDEQLDVDINDYETLDEKREAVFEAYSEKEDEES